MEETVKELIQRLNELPAVKDVVIEVSPGLYNYIETKVPIYCCAPEDNKQIPIHSYYGITVIINHELTEYQWKVSLMGRE